MSNHWFLTLTQGLLFRRKVWQRKVRQNVSVRCCLFLQRYCHMARCRKVSVVLFGGTVLLQTLAMQGCAVVEVKPWQRGVLAKVEMSGVPDPMEEKMRGHVYFSKEASSGGASAGGGGCGCN